jgi:flagellar FliL protein
LKANPKIKADAKADSAAGGNPKKALLLIVGGVVVALVLGLGAAWYLTMGSSDKAPKAAKIEPPEYVALEPFTVNLQADEGEHYLQVQFTLQVANLEQAEVLKSNMAQVRNRVLLLLSAKRASELNTVEGKRQLAGEIAATLKQPFFAKGQPQHVGDVLFTAFIIQ